MAYTAINDPSKYFQTDAYTGEGNGTVITNDGNSDLQPDLVWFKRSGGLGYHQVVDSTRGGTARIWANNSGAEGSPQSHIASFDSDGFTCGSSTDLAPADTCVAWQWKANGGSTSSNTSGTITSTVQANTTAGFSIVTYTGNDTDPATYGHGLGAVPHFIMTKRRNAANSWVVYNRSLGADKSLFLDLDIAVESSSFYQETPTSTLITINDHGNINGGSGATYVSYIWSEKQGYSKFGQYIGNNNVDGTFVYTGFKPAWIMVKEKGATRNWGIADPDELQLRNGGVTNALFPNQNYGQDANERVDIYSNGFKLKTTSTTWNTSAGTFIFAAFAERPFVSSEGIPCTAR